LVATSKVSKISFIENIIDIFDIFSILNIIDIFDIFHFKCQSIDIDSQIKNIKNIVICTMIYIKPTLDKT
jgi:hypothetical protein